MVLNADSTLQSAVKQARAAYMNAHVEYVKACEGAMLADPSEQLKVLLGTLKKNRDSRSAEYERLKAVQRNFLKKSA